MELDLSELEDLVSILVIGDTHFKPKNYEEGEELIERCVEVAANLKPSKIVLLGDILDTHEIAKNGPWKQACRFIDELSQITEVYVIMGNHDLINQKQFLTDNHFFNPLKKWPNVFIVDTPISVDIGNQRSIVLCPYVFPGRFEEALDCMINLGGCDEDYDWRTDAICVFCHQEIEGVEYGGKISTKGDRWSEEYPPLICGHIHTPYQIGENVFYPGSSRQVDSNENPDKKIWNITFDDENKIEIDKIDLGLKGIKEILLEYENLEDFDFGLAKKYHIKLKLRGLPEQFKIFRKSKIHAKMMLYGIKISFDPIRDDNESYGCQTAKEVPVFSNIFAEIVSQKSENVQDAYNELFGIETVIETEIVFGK